MVIVAMSRLVMFCQGIPSKVVCQIPHNRMNVGTTALGIVVFDQKGRAVQAVVMGTFRFPVTSPGKMDLPDAARSDAP